MTFFAAILVAQVLLKEKKESKNILHFLLPSDIYYVWDFQKREPNTRCRAPHVYQLNPPLEQNSQEDPITLKHCADLVRKSVACDGSGMFHYNVNNGDCVCSTVGACSETEPKIDYNVFKLDDLHGNI